MNFTSLDVETDLGLSKINVPKTSRNAVIPDELNSYLRDQLSQVTHENEELKKELSDTEINLRQSQEKIAELAEKVKEYEGVCNQNEYVSAAQLANSKIVELSRKLREKKAEVEVLKTKCAKLEKNLAESKHNAPETGKVDAAACEANELKKLQDRLSQSTNKLQEMKNSNFKLKHDLKVANKWLQQEIGDNFETLLALNGSNSNWRGRAQIICDLQQKNLELKEKLKEHQGKSVPSSKSSQPKPDKVQRENSEIRSNFEELKRKFEAARARCKALETESAMLKVKISTMTENGDRDRRIIASLTSQVNGQNERKSGEAKQKEQEIRRLRQENELLQVELEKERCAVQNKDDEVKEKLDEIEALTRKIRASRPPSSYISRPENGEAKAIARLEAEKLRLLELTEVQARRLEEEREAHSKTQTHLRCERQRGAKLEANLARLELEQTCGKSTYRSHRSPKSEQSVKDLCELSFQDRCELAEETVKALTTRLEIEVYERKMDLQEFVRILRDSDRNKTND